MNTRLISVGSACFLAGAALATLLSGKLPGGNKELPISPLPQAASNSRDATIPRGSGDRPASSPTAKDGGIVAPQAMGFKDLSEAKFSTLESISGLASPGQNGPLVVVSAGLIKQFSQAGQVRSLDQALFTGSDQLAASLQINEAEKQRLESEWNSFRERIRALEKKNATIQEMPDGTLEIVLSGLSVEMARLSEGFRSSAKAIVGDNRSEILYAAAQIDSVVDELGQDRKMVVRTEETGDGGWRYHAVVEGARGKRVYVGENVPQSIRSLTGDLQTGSF